MTNEDGKDVLNGSPQRSVPEGTTSGASGGATADNLDLPPPVRTDSGSEGGVRVLPLDKAPTAEALPKN